MSTLLLFASAGASNAINVTTNFLSIDGSWYEPLEPGEALIGSFGTTGTNSPGIFASGGGPSTSASGFLDSFNLNLSASCTGSGGSGMPPNIYINALGITHFFPDGPYLEVTLQAILGTPMFGYGVCRFTLSDLTTSTTLFDVGPDFAEHPTIYRFFTLAADPSHEYAFILEGADSAEPSFPDKQVIAHATITAVPESHTTSLLTLYLCALAGARIKARNTAIPWIGFR